MREAQPLANRRDFVKCCAATSTAALVWRTPSCAAEEERQNEWATATDDPARKLFSGTPDLDKVLALFPRTQGPPAFDPKLIDENITKLQTSPKVDTGHPLLDKAVLTGLAHIDATFRGDHPRYGAGTYAASVHDGFPPTIIAAVDALSAWGMHRRACELFRYWLAHFVKDDGQINYYGPSIAEYGQLLHTPRCWTKRAGPDGWWPEGFPALDRMAEHLLRLCAAASKDDGLISGVPEADTRKDTAKYFHNNAWVVKGLRRWGDLCQRRNGSPTTAVDAVRKAAGDLSRNTLGAIEKTWPAPIRPIGGCHRRSSPSPGRRRWSWAQRSALTRTIVTGPNCSPAGSCRRRWPTGSSRRGSTAADSSAA